MGFEPCPECGNETSRRREQIAGFTETVDEYDSHGTDVHDWGSLLYDECAECGEVLFEHELHEELR